METKERIKATLLAVTTLALLAPQVYAQSSDSPMYIGFTSRGVPVDKQKLSMPGIGLSASCVQLHNRINYAVESGRLGSNDAAVLLAQADALSAQMDIVKSSGKPLPADMAQRIAKDIWQVNANLELKLQTPPSADTADKELVAVTVNNLKAQHADLLERIRQGLEKGKLEPATARKLKQQANTVIAVAKGQSPTAQELKQPTVT